MKAGWKRIASYLAPINIPSAHTGPAQDNVPRMQAIWKKIASYLAKPGMSTVFVAARETATVTPTPSVPVILNVAKTTVTGVMGMTAVRKKVREKQKHCST